MKRVYLVPVFLIPLLTLQSCDIFGLFASCGEHRVFDMQWTNFSGSASNPNVGRTYVRDGMRFFQWSTPFIENVCTDEHIDVRVSFYVTESALPSLGFNVFGRYALREPAIPRITGGRERDVEIVSYQGDFGIKDAFVDDPGTFEVYAEIFFNTFGSLEEDQEFFFEAWTDVFMTVDYFDHQEG